MSYVSYKEIEVNFPQSASLASAKYNPECKAVSVSYESAPDFYYDHDECEWEDFNHLLSLIEDRRSGYYGYKEWKEIRKAYFQRHDRKRFEELWADLNEYQRDNLIEFVQEQRVAHWQIRRVPINRRR